MLGRLLGRGGGDPALLAELDELSNPARVALVNAELRAEHAGRTSTVLVTSAHQAVDDDDVGYGSPDGPREEGTEDKQGGGGVAVLARQSSSQVLQAKLGGGRSRRKRLRQHRELLLASTGGEHATHAALQRQLSRETNAVERGGPPPPPYRDLGRQDLRDMQSDAAVAGMARGRAVFFRKVHLDLLFWLRNEHPVLACFLAHPLHPFTRHAHARFLVVVVLFGIFSSVVTLVRCENSAQNKRGAHHQLTQQMNMDELHHTDEFRKCYEESVLAFAAASTCLQLLMATLAVCPCMQPGGSLYCCRCICAACCTRVGHEGLVICSVAAVCLGFVALVLALVHGIDVVDILLATLHTKLLSFLMAFGVQSAKFFYCRRRQKPLWARGSTATNSVYLHPELPTRDFMLLTDFGCVGGLCVKCTGGFEQPQDTLHHAGMHASAS
jgi:hypothetical protein